MTQTHLIEAADLATLLGTPGVIVLDASWYLPAAGRDPRAEFLDAHIPGARYFDIDAASEPGSPLPHTLASEAHFTDFLQRLGVDQGATIVVYDGMGLFSAARAWWNLRLAGATDVRVLNGGLPAWKALGLPLETGPATSHDRGTFVARYDRALVRDFTQMLAIVGSGDATIVDARGAPRFKGEAPEPRAGVASGHIAGSRNLPYSSLLDSNGRLLPEPELRTAFDSAGVDPAAPIVTTCGSGVTAAILALGLAELGRPDIPVYDGSWSEWGSRPESAALIATGE